MVIIVFDANRTALPFDSGTAKFPVIVSISACSCSMLVLWLEADDFSSQHIIKRHRQQGMNNAHTTDGQTLLAITSHISRVHCTIH